MGTRTQVEIGKVWDATSDPPPAALPDGVVHLWQRSLQAPDAAVEACYEVLSAEERERAHRFRIERPRREFVLTRGTLRSLLAHYLAITPQEIRFRYTKHGKPLLDTPGDLRFNVSHSGDLALMAFVKGREVGVDVEKVVPQTEVEQLAERFFSARERSDLRNFSGEELRAAFFRCWTRKEAYIKAKGEGLSLPLDQFDVSIAIDDRDALLATRPDSSEAGRWTLCDIRTSPGYAGALAVGDGGEKS
ncbi:MAG TPA: 4'-phosphopantetheinyl transferase superfamily protein [Candidatus Dormibacteraeota bacterium]|nr:4'-phosphopantetheinyl transferase superfamily protein [Candidatus Dormibacteraeota bacterium]